MDTQAALTIRDSSACGEVRVLDHVSGNLPVNRPLKASE